MPKTKITLAVSILILATLACNAILPNAEPAPTSIIEIEERSTPSTDHLPQTEDDVPRVSLEEALVAHYGGAAIFVDVRSADNFALSHVPGAINIPVNEIEANPAIVNLNKDQWIITYCT
jgi:ArsR family transcriptional regulator